MKYYIIKTVMLLFIFLSKFDAQTTDSLISPKLQLGKIEPYELTVTYDKTTHLIFPSAIKYVDLGSENLIAGKAESVENVLRLKASVKDFEKETNFSVITNDGKFYSFDVFYSSYPESLSYDLKEMKNKKERIQSGEVLLEELGSNSPTLTDLLMESIFYKNKKEIRHISDRRFGIKSQLKGIYIHEGKFYLHTEIKNFTNVPFIIDFISYKIVDKKVAKRTVVQDTNVEVLRTYHPIEQISGERSERSIFLLNQLGIEDDKFLLIEFFEKNGSRHQTLQIENADLVKAKVLNELHVTF